MRPRRCRGQASRSSSSFVPRFALNRPRPRPGLFRDGGAEAFPRPRRLAAPLSTTATPLPAAPAQSLHRDRGRFRPQGARVRSPALRPCLPGSGSNEVGMSYLGHKILYTILNNREDIFAEGRVYAPAGKPAGLREHGVSLATLESDTDIVKTHMFAFAITHELCFTNVLYMLELSGIPLRAADRGDDLFRWPLNRRGRRMRHCLGTARPVHGPHAPRRRRGDGPGIVRPRDQGPRRRLERLRA